MMVNLWNTEEASRAKNYLAVVVTRDKLLATLSDTERVTVKDIGDLLELFMHAQKT